ncbi:MAG: hypothetical protein GX951_03655 [Mollicutes bacterium]|nr:hypothetical protein [Mollicutes bacterium]
MKINIKIIIISLIIGFISFPFIALGGIFTSSLFDGKTIEEALHIIGNKIEEIFIIVNDIENKQSKLEKEIYCLELIKKTPEWGTAYYINNDIVKFYESAKEQLDNFENDPAYHYPGMLEKWKKAVEEAEPLYIKYIEECKNN